MYNFTQKHFFYGQTRSERFMSRFYSVFVIFSNKNSGFYDDINFELSVFLCVVEYVHESVTNKF